MRGESSTDLERLGTDYIDLYQFHALTRYDELDTVTGEYRPEMAQSHDEGRYRRSKRPKQRESSATSD